ncbi:hypothetical protein A3J36_00150 [Candidatus Uhrbacteria bacterium RIFCSPLOWO2_02_FULL_54_37]|uniref:Uncharacterized protein n=1 Tax=Candidatus Uhrbacteria bacterium RIFCSPLOWO2_02_FULL_54_37 TaxID=1802412 RepID=A0A1F7VIA8_9BACT|nr:MAG: hypothetical protein A3J36_00150 [Candidatus Uhrbacteria bacterium RIFCSPLOWO2_02_FULL_54_37]
MDNLFAFFCVYYSEYYMMGYKDNAKISEAVVEVEEEEKDVELFTEEAQKQEKGAIDGLFIKLGMNKALACGALGVALLSGCEQLVQSYAEHQKKKADDKRIEENAKSLLTPGIVSEATAKSVVQYLEKEGIDLKDERTVISSKEEGVFPGSEERVIRKYKDVGGSLERALHIGRINPFVGLGNVTEVNYNYEVIFQYDDKGMVTGIEGKIHNLLGESVASDLIKRLLEHMFLNMKIEIQISKDEREQGR